MPEPFWDFLHDIRVLDLTDEKGLLCGKMLADFGADVIKVEPPGGNTSRSRTPRYKDSTCTEGSLVSFFYDVNKRSISLNLRKERGRNLFLALAKRADIVLESFSPGTAEELGIDYKDLVKVNSNIIVTAITPFGRTGIYKDMQETDIVMMGMGGLLYLTGDSDRPPVQVGYPQAYLHAGAEAAVATLMALYHREISGKGQLIDISIQQSLLTSNFQVPNVWYLNKEMIRRTATERTVGPGLQLPVVWPCKDGYVSFTVLGGVPGRKTMGSLAKWMDEEGMGDDYISQDWGLFDFYGFTTEDVQRTVKPITNFFMLHTKAELFEGFMKRGIMGFAITNTEDIVKDQHLGARGFWQEIEHSGLGRKIFYPSSPARVNDEYSPLKARAPYTGEHNEEIYSVILNLSKKDLNSLKEENVI